MEDFQLLSLLGLRYKNDQISHIAQACAKLGLFGGNTHMSKYRYTKGKKIRIVFILSH